MGRVGKILPPMARRFGLQGTGGLLRLNHDLAAQSGGFFFFLTGTIIFIL
jgi:hypothetical protein